MAESIETYVEQTLQRFNELDPALASAIESSYESGALKRRIIEYLLSPLARHSQQALRER
jgi:hypothetical protein